MLDHMKLRTVTLHRSPATWLFIALIVTVASYWTGLHGPFLLDDEINFEVITRWVSGQASLWDVLFSNSTGTFGRPLSMASLALSAGVGGYQPFAFKLGNLAVHLACGCVVYALLRRIARRDPRLHVRANAAAAIVAALWLLHPLHASTVLYSVQRMAQLSTLLVLLGMWLYMAARMRLDQGRSPWATIGLFLGIPTLTLLGFLAKENGALLPALCLVLEVGCFREQSRPGAVKVFFGAYLALPATAGLVAFSLLPGWLAGGYALRDFSWQERLLTESRALCDYLWKIIAPNPPRMGVYTDDFAASSGLLSPPTTAISLFVLLAISYTAWHLRRRVPALLIGWSVFLVGHVIESSILPLELYFEHRNYLPMIGVLYAVVGMCFALGDRLRNAGIRLDRIAVVLTLGVIASLAFGTHGRARVWSSPETLAISAVASHPQSARANSLLVDVALRHGNRQLAEQALQRMIAADNPRTRALGYLSKLNLECATTNSGAPNDLAQAVLAMPPKMTYSEPNVFGVILKNTVQGCGPVTDAMLGTALDTMLDHASQQSDRQWPKWRSRHLAGQFFARAEDWHRALEQAKLAWQSSADPAAAVLLVQAQLATGDLAGAERTYGEVAARIDSKRADDVAGLRWLRGQIHSARQSPATTIVE